MTTLTTEETNRSLYAKKKKEKEKPKVTKVALENPLPDYWPVLSSEDARVITEYLQKCLVFEQKSKLSYKEVRKLSKEERKEKIREINNANRSEAVQEQRKNVVFGINQVMRNMERGSLTACLVAGDVEPVIIAKSIVYCAVARSVPVLVLHGMKAVLKESAGFTSVAIGLTFLTEDADSGYHHLYKLLKNLSLAYPVPKLLQRTCPSQTDLLEATRKHRGRKQNLERSSVQELAETNVSLQLRTAGSTGENCEIKESSNVDSKAVGSSADDVSSLVSSSIDTVCFEPLKDSDTEYLPPKLKKMRKNPKRKMRHQERLNKS